MDPDSTSTEKIQELQALEHNLQAFLMEKQSLQIELNECSNAIEELKNSKDEAYKILSGIMIKSSPSDLINELSEKKRLLDMRISSMERQESILSEKAESLRSDISRSVIKKKS